MGRFVWRRQLIQWSRQSFIFAGTVGKLPEPAATVIASPAANGKPGRHSGACIANVLASATKRGITFDAQQNGRQTFFFVFGLGLGDFLYDLITKTDAKVVVVIEPNPDFLHYAAQVVDWALILNLTASSQACDIRFITLFELDRGRGHNEIHHSRDLSARLTERCFIAITTTVFCRESGKTSIRGLRPRPCWDSDSLKTNSG